MFLKFFLDLFLISIIFPFIYSLIIIPISKLLITSISEKESKNIIVQAIVILIFLINVYILSGWSAYVAFHVLMYTSLPGIPNVWLYYTVGFFLCYGPLGYMAVKGRLGEDINSILYIIIAMIAYIIFLIFPILMKLLYGWFLY